MRLESFNAAPPLVQVFKCLSPCNVKHQDHSSGFIVVGLWLEVVTYSKFLSVVQFLIPLS